MVNSTLITGAAGGIGRALCDTFREDGYHVIGLDQPGTYFPNSCNAKISCDLEKLCQDLDYRSEVIAQVKANLTENPLQVLINNAAVQEIQPTEKLTPEHWHNTLDVNLVAPFLLIQALLKDLTKTKGSVINLASIHAKLTKPKFVCYATSKAALVGLTRSLAVDLGNQVRVNAIAPAAVATPMLMAGFVDKTEMLDQLSQMHPIGRIATPLEIAQAALFLASDRASFITGTVLELDGGINARLHDPD